MSQFSFPEMRKKHPSLQTVAHFSIATSLSPSVSSGNNWKIFHTGERKGMARIDLELYREGQRGD